MKKQNKYGGRWSAIPAFGESGGMMRRQCTADYKIVPVIKSIRNHKVLTNFSYSLE